MAKKQTNPEITIDSKSPYSGIIGYAHEASHIRSETAALQTKELTAKIEMAKLANRARIEELKKGNYVGLMRVTDDGLNPVRIEFRNTGKCLDVGQEPELDRLFGSARPLLFERAKVVTEILDPEQVIADMKAAGKNPWDFIKLEIKDGSDSIVAENTTAVTSDEGFVGVKGMLNTLNNVGSTLSDEAKSFIKEYLDNVLEPKVVLGTKGASS